MAWLEQLADALGALERIAAAVERIAAAAEESNALLRDSITGEEVNL